MSKKVLMIGGAVVLLIIIVILVINGMKPKPKVQKVSTFVKSVQTSKSESSASLSESIDTTNLSEVNQKLGLSTTESSSNESTTNSDDSTTDTSNVELVKATMQTYSAINLEPKSLDSRSQKLKTQLSDDVYKSLKIDDETNTLKKMLVNWKTKKEIDTNQPYQLLEQSIQSLKVYLNDTDANDFVVIVTEQLKSPSSPNTSLIVRQYAVTTSNNKVSKIIKTSEVAGEE